MGKSKKKARAEAGLAKSDAAAADSSFPSIFYTLDALVDLYSAHYKQSPDVHEAILNFLQSPTLWTTAPPLEGFLATKIDTKQRMHVFGLETLTEIIQRLQAHLTDLRLESPTLPSEASLPPPPPPSPQVLCYQDAVPVRLYDITYYQALRTIVAQPPPDKVVSRERKLLAKIKARKEASLSARRTYEKAKVMMAGGRVGPAGPVTEPQTFLSLDVEAWEHNQSILTEVGWTIYNAATKEMTSKHFIVQEHERRFNGKYVPDHKYDFLFPRGSSVTTSFAKTMRFLVRDIKGCGVFVGHALASDVAFLASQNVFLGPGVQCLDTQHVYAGWAGAPGTISLKKLCALAGIEPECLHNAGNDAKYTMDCLIHMCAHAHVA